MATLVLTAQNVNGDPFTTGANINITTNVFTTLTFTDFDFQLGDPQAGETVSLDGGATQLSYTFLGYGDVRSDPLQAAAFIRVQLPSGQFQTFAIDMNADGDAQPSLAAGNTKLTTASLSSGPAQRFPAPACFTPGTLVETPQGPQLIETLAAGDMVCTRDNGPQRLRAVLSERCRATGRFAPVRFEAGAFGNTEPLTVSPQHRMLVTGWQAQLYSHEDEVLVAATHLVNGRTITRQEGGEVTYIHLVFDAHQIVIAGGVPSESYYAGRLEDIRNQATLDELHALFPEMVEAEEEEFYPMARPVMHRTEAALLVA